MLIHGAGARFSQDGQCRARVTQYNYRKGSSGYDLLLNKTTQLKEKLEYVLSINPKVLCAIDNAEQDTSGRYRFKTDINNPITDIDVTYFSSLGLLSLDTRDAAAAFGAIKVQVDQVQGSYHASQIDTVFPISLLVTIRGAAVDTFDFNYGKKTSVFGKNVDINTEGAIVQLGNESVSNDAKRRNQGQVFITKTEFDEFKVLLYNITIYKPGERKITDGPNKGQPLCK